MKRLSAILILSLSILMLNSCKTDFDVTASYKEIAIVYGILNQKDPSQIVRINKAFLGDGNALLYAQSADSSAFGPELKVSLEERKNGSVTRVINFDTLTIHDKDTGVFYSPDQLIYAAEAVLDSSCDYQLIARNMATGYEVTSATNLIYGLRIVKPMPSAKILDMKRSVTATQAFEWYSAVNGRRYQPLVRFYYKEVSLQHDTITRVVEWALAGVKSTTLDGGEKLSFFFQNEQLYVECQNQVPYSDPDKEASIARIPDHFELIMTILGDEFSTYLDVNGPSSGLLLEKPAYSNINNGIGMFSCRYEWVKNYKVGENAKTDLNQTTNLHFVIN